MPPIRWDVRLAHWFDENILPKEKHPSYAYPSRRQASTPDLPRPRYIRTEIEKMASTFGVIIDTSGSMSAEDIGKALGSISSYAASKDVPAVRVVFCDADAYDAGYIATDQIAGRVKVIGRGGTRLQPAVDLFDRAKDFPKDGPILIITDGWIEKRLTIHRRHAFLLPAGRALPFRPKGEVFFFD
jgi:predicted metal-dependent peptidase